MRHPTPVNNDRPDLAKRLCTKVVFGLGLFGPVLLPTIAAPAQRGDKLIDDFSRKDLVSNLGTQWRGVSDQVMGGISEASAAYAKIDGRACIRISGDVRLDNNGGFIQAALDLVTRGGTLDASAYSGLRLIVSGNDERYSVHLRTPDSVRPWQSYRAHFNAGSKWETIDVPFGSFEPHRLEVPLDVARLRRIGLVAIGREFHADLAIAEVGFYR